MKRIIKAIQEENEQEVMACMERRTKKGWTMMHLAAQYGKVRLVKKMMMMRHKKMRKKEPMENQETKQGETVMHIAAKYGQAPIVEELQKEKVPYTRTRNEGYTPGHVAAMRGNQHVLRLFEKENPIRQYEKDKKGWTWMHHAVAKGHLNVANAWAQANHQQQVPEPYLGEWLHLAIAHQQVPMVQWLLCYIGKEEGKETMYPNKDNETTLYKAVTMGQVAIVRLLLDERATPHVASTTTGMCPIHVAAYYDMVEMLNVLLKVCNVNVNSLYRKATPLYFAAQQGRVQAVQRLLEAKATIHVKTIQGQGVLQAPAKAGHLSIVKMLLQEATNHPFENRELYDALWEASQQGQVHVMKVLLQAGAPTNGPCQSPRLLHESIAKDRVNVVNLLLAFKARMHQKDEEGNEAIHWVQSTTMLDVLYKESPTCLQAVDGKGNTILHQAIAKSALFLAEHVLSLSTEALSIQNHQGDTPLHVAIRHQDELMVSLLLQHQHVSGCSLNHDGNTPLALALGLYSSHIVFQLLQQRVHRVVSSQKNHTHGYSPLHLAILFQQKPLIFL